MYSRTHDLSWPLLQLQQNTLLTTHTIDVGCGLRWNFQPETAAKQCNSVTSMICVTTSYFYGQKMTNWAFNTHAIQNMSSIFYRFTYTPPHLTLTTSPDIHLMYLTYFSFSIPSVSSPPQTLSSPNPASPHPPLGCTTDWGQLIIKYYLHIYSGAKLSWLLVQ